MFKNSSGLGFSFSREDSLIPEQMNASIVRVKKLFPGQPAAESGKIEVGDVILKVNGASLKGLSQQVSPQVLNVILLIMRWISLSLWCHSAILTVSSFVIHGTPRKSSLLSGEHPQKYPCFYVDLHLVCYQKLTLLFWWELWKINLYFYRIAIEWLIQLSWFCHWLISWVSSTLFFN